MQVFWLVVAEMANNDGISGLISEKLDKNNFHAWKFRMTNFLMAIGSTLKVTKWLHLKFSKQMQLLES